MRGYLRREAFSPDNGAVFIKTMKNIANALGVSEGTVRNWAEHDGFPLAKLPNGTWATTPSLVDAWLTARNPAYNTVLRAQNKDSVDARPEV